MRDSALSCEEQKVRPDIELMASVKVSASFMLLGYITHLKSATNDICIPFYFNNDVFPSETDFFFFYNFI